MKFEIDGDALTELIGEALARREGLTGAYHTTLDFDIDLHQRRLTRAFVTLEPLSRAVNSTGGEG